MNKEAKICPFMSSTMNYQYCIDKCNFYDQYVGCLIKYSFQELHNNSENIMFDIQDIVKKL